jgi:hypothetical protein
MTGTQGGLGSTTEELRLHGEKAGEHGPGETERLEANQRVSCVDGDEAELTEATNATDDRRWPRNERWTTTELHGSARRAKETKGVRLGA